MAPSIPTELLVLIESDWNLKTERRKIILQRIVRINRIRLEFKDYNPRKALTPEDSINRIRLEFKAEDDDRVGLVALGINRIRLEFKVALANGRSLKRQVLIESDWNLKSE